MKLENLNLTELNFQEITFMNGGDAAPVELWEKSYKYKGSMAEAIVKIAHEVGDFLRGFYDGLK